MHLFFIFAPASSQIAKKHAQFLCTNEASMSSSIYCKHRTVQRNQPCTKEQKTYTYVTCRSERDNASRQTELARATSCHRAYVSTSRCVLKTNKEIESCQAKINTQPVTSIGSSYLIAGDA